MLPFVKPRCEADPRFRGNLAFHTLAEGLAVADPPEEQTIASRPSNPPPMPSLAADGVLTIHSEDLFPPGSNEVRIVHAGMTYRLLRTRNSKLILVK